MRAIAYFMALCSMALEAAPAAAQAIVPNGYFTNVYVYQKSYPTETWEDHLVAANKRDPGLRPHEICPIPGLSNFDAFSRKCIDAFTREVMRPTWPSYFDPLAHYITSQWFGIDTKYIHPPLFFGSGVALERCVDHALHDAHNGVVQWDTVVTLANCHDSGMDPSPQVNLIFSPDIKLADVRHNIVFRNGPEMCAAQQADAYHAWGVSVPNFTVLPTRSACVQNGFVDFTTSLTHEVVELLSDPGAVAYGSPGTYEIGDLCEVEDPTTMVTESWTGLPLTNPAAANIQLTLSRYCIAQELPGGGLTFGGSKSCKAFAGTCQPRLDPPNQSVAQTWVLGQGEPLFEFTGHAHTLTLSMPTSRVITDAPLTQALLVVQTGGDDLRGGSHPGDNADVTLGFVGGGQVVTGNANQSARWANHTTQSVILNMPQTAAKVSDISSVTISTNFGGGLGGDNWKVDSVALVVSYPSGSVTSGPIPPSPVVHDWLIRSELPLIRFTKNVHDLVLPLTADDLPPQDLAQVVSALNLIISTGNDDLRGGSNPGDNCDVTIQLTSGPPIVLKNVNGGQKWDNWTNHTISIPLPAAGLHGGDVVSVTLHTGFSGGLFGLGADNWNVEQVILEATLAPQPCDGCAVASAIAAGCVADDPTRASFDPTHGTVGFAKGASGHIKLTCPVRTALSSPTAVDPSPQRQLSMTFYNDNAVIRSIQHCSIAAEFLRSNLDNTEAGADIATIATTNQPLSGRQTLSTPVGQLDFSTSYYWVDVDLFRDSPVAVCNPAMVGVFLE
jgi:hypothetical protein